MNKGLNQDTAKSRVAEPQPGLDEAVIPRGIAGASGLSGEPAAELSGTSFKFKLDQAQREALSSSLREALKPGVASSLSRTQNRIAASAREFSLRRVLRLEAGRTLIDGMLSIATVILKLLDKLLMFLLRTKKPILTRLILPKSAQQLEGLGDALKQKKKKTPGRDGAAMV